MTSVDGVAGGRPEDHLDAVAIGDLEEGLLAPEDAIRAQSHLEACEQCRELHADLVALRTLLAGLPDPGPMPAAVVTRIENALVGAQQWSDHEARRRDHPRWSARLLQVAAAGVVIIALGALAVPVLRGSGDGSASESSAGGAATTMSSPPPTPRVLQSGGRYTAGTLPDAARALAAGRTDPAVPTTGKAPQRNLAEHGPSARLHRLAEPATLRACTDALTVGATEPPLAVDLATYEGAPAAVVVLPARDDPSSLDVYVVGPGCQVGDTEVRYFRRVPR